MATSSGNKLIPIFAAVAVLIVGVVMVKQCSAPSAVKPGEKLTQVPSPERPLPEAKGADGDTPTETLATVVASNRELRNQVQQVIEENRRLQAENRRLERGGGSAAALPPARDETPAARSSRATQDAIDDLAPGASPLPEPEESPTEETPSRGPLDTVASALESLLPTLPTAKPQPKPQQQARAQESGGNGMLSGVLGTAPAGPPPGRVNYQTMAPMGYAVMSSSSGGRNSGGVVLTRYVRTTVPSDPDAGGGSGGTATRAAQSAQQKQKSTPYFTIPENSTLVGATGMTALIGRVPIDGRVTDPLQFKAVIGRDNLAANGFELPPDLEGMIVSGIAVGDMALSCTEGKVRSLTFVFQDGTIRTVSSSNKKGSVTSSSSNSDLGFISDSWGNPCIAGKFVTNAPRYLTDIVGLSALGVAGQAYADAQRTTFTSSEGTQSSISGDVGHYALGQAVAGATNEVQRWMLSRLKNSFDAVVVPAGKQMVVHIDKEIWLDKATNGRRLVHRRQKTIAQGGQRYGLQ